MDGVSKSYFAYSSKRKKILLVLIVLLTVSIFTAASVGATPIPILETLSILLHKIPLLNRWMKCLDFKDIHSVIILHIRLPRILLAVIIGGSLGGAGATLQGLFGNPLADPYIMGISSGAALGATIAIVGKLSSPILGLSPVPVAAFIASVFTMVIVHYLAGIPGRVSMEKFLLSGVVVSSFFWAVMSFIMMISGDSLREIMMWLMGTLSNKNYTHVKMAFPYALFGILILVIMSKDLNLLCLGDDEARYLGVDPEVTKMITISASSLVTAASVSVGGIIGFIGLIIPHIMRIVLGPDHRLLLPASVISGGIFLVLADMVARTLIAPTEIPVGVITALTGAPFFFFILKRNGNNV